MRILIHAANLQKGGALQVAASLLEEFTKQPEYQFHLLASPPVVETVAARLAIAPFAITTIQESPTHGLRAWRSFLRIAQRAEQTWKPDAVLTIFGPGLWRPRAPHLMGFANGLYLFSNSRFIREDWPKGGASRARYALRRHVLLRRVRCEADAWWVETGTAKQALLEAARIPDEKIIVIPNALGLAFLPYLHTPMLNSTKPEGEKSFRVLVMGAAYPNKNLSLVPAMLQRLDDASIQFCFTLPTGEFTRLVVESGKDSRMDNLGPLTPNEAPLAYAGVDAVLIPSKLETFSAVLLEAAAMQKPLLVPDLPFARDVCEDSAQYFDPWDADSAVRALRVVMENAPLRNRLIQKGYERIQAAPTAAFRAHRILHMLETLSGHRER